MSRTSLRSNADLPPSGRRVPRSSRGDGWNALADIEVFIFAVEAELEAMDHEWAGLHRRGRKPDLTRRRRLIRLISRYVPTGRGTGTLDQLQQEWLTDAAGIPELQ